MLVPVGGGVDRKVVSAQLQGDLAAGRNLHRGRQHLGVGEDAGHLRRALEIELVRLELHAARGVHGLAGLDAQQDVVGPGVFGLQIVHVVGGHHGQTPAGPQFQQRLVDLELLRQVVGLDLQVEPSRKDLGVLPGAGLGGRGVVVEELRRHHAVEAGGQGDEAPVQLLKQLLVHPGPVIEPFLVGPGDQPDEVVVALQVFRQDHQVAVVPLARLFLAGAGGHVELAPQQGLDPRGLGLLVEIQDPEEGAVVGDGHRRHAVSLGLGQQVFHPDGPVQQAVGGVDMEMDEFRVGHGSRRASPLVEITSRSS